MKALSAIHKVNFNLLHLNYFTLIKFCENLFLSTKMNYYNELFEKKSLSRGFVKPKYMLDQLTFRIKVYWL